MTEQQPEKAEPDTELTEPRWESEFDPTGDDDDPRELPDDHPKRGE